MEEFSPEWFDDSSAAWRANKRRVGESWVYKRRCFIAKAVAANPVSEKEVYDQATPRRSARIAYASLKEKKDHRKEQNGGQCESHTGTRSSTTWHGRLRNT